MIKKIKEFLKQRKLKKKKVLELKQYKKFYKMVQEGQMFLDFILQDIAQSKKNKMNRAQRRRFEKDIMKNGKITPEIIAYYKVKVKQVLIYIEQQKQALNKKPVQFKQEEKKDK